MADQNQTVHTVFTGEADLAAAQKSLNDFIKSWTGGIGAVNKALEGVDAETLKKIQNYQKMVATAAKAQAAMDKKSPESVALSGAAASRRNIRAQTATITGELEAYRKGVSKSLAGTVLMIDQELKAIDDRLGKIGTQRRKFATEIAQLAAERDRLSGNRQTIAANPFVAAELSGARSAKAKAALKSNAADDRAWQAASEALIKSRLRLLQVETELSGLSAKGGGKAPAQVGRLRAEEAQLQELIRTYEAFSQVRDRANNPNGKMMSSALAKGRREIVTEARSVIDAEQRILELKERIRKSEDGTAVLSATNLKHAQNELRMTEAATAAHLKDEAVLERVARLKAAKANPTGATTDPTGPARRLLDIDSMRVKAEAEINRLRVLGGAEDLKQIAQLQAGLRLLASEAVELSKIKNIEEAITLERLKRKKEPVAPKGPHSPNADRLRMDGGVGIMGVQTEVMANYAVISAMTQSAYALGQFVVQYEAALAQFQAIAAASDSETSRLSLTIAKLGQSTRFTNLEIATTATLLAQAGLSARETEGALKSITMLAAAAGTELKQAADVVTSIASVWNITTDEYGKIADVLTAALNRTKLGMDQIQLGIQYAANTAQDAGIGFNELTSALGAMANAGIRSGSTLGTGLRALIVDLETPTDKARASYERLGLTLSDTDIRTQGLTQVLANLKAKGFGASDAFNAFEIRAAAAYTALANNVDVMVDLQGQLRDTGAATEANAVQMDTLAAKWVKFTNVLKTSGDGALAPVLIVMKGIMDVGTGVIATIGALGPVGQGAAVGVAVLMSALAIGKFVAATTALKEMALAIRLLPPALAIATATTEAFALAETRATVATGMFSGALTFLNRVPIVLLVAGLAAVVAGLFSAFGAFKQTATRADELKGEINDLNSRMDQTKKSISDVDSTITRLSQNLSVLSDHDIMRGQVLQEAKDKFYALGLEIDDSSDSVEGMITALGKLRVELQKQFSSELLSLADKLQERIKTMNLDLQQGEAVPDADQGAVVGRFGTAALSGGAGVPHETPGPNNRTVGYGAGAVLAYNAVARPEQVFDEKGELINGITPDAMRRAQTDLIKIRNDLQMKRDVTVDPRAKADLTAQIDDLKVLITNYDLVLDRVRAVINAQSDLASKKRDLAYSNFMATPEKYSAAKLPTELRSAMEPFFKEMEGLKRKQISAEEMVKQAAEIASRASIVGDAQYQEAIKRSSQLRPEFQERYLNDIATQRNTAISSLTGWVDPLRASGAQGARASGAAGQQANNDTQAIDADVAAAKMKTLERQMQELETELASATSGAKVELLRMRYESLLKQWEPLRMAQENTSLEARGYYDRGGTVDVLAPAVRSQESRGRADAVSPKGALGTMQLMPGTARSAARRLGRTDIATLSEDLLEKKLLADPALNDLLGREELRYLLQRYDGNTVLALAAYNAGPGRLDGYTDSKGKFQPGWLKTIGDPRKPGGPSNQAFAAAIPIKETREYIPGVLGRIADPTMTTQDPRFGVIRGEAQAQATAEVEARRLAFTKAARSKELAVEEAEIARGLKAERTSNEAEIKFLLGNLKSVEGSMSDLTTAVGKIDTLSRRNFDITEEAFWNDPRNADRRGDSQAINELEGQLREEITKAAEIRQDALDAYIKARDLAPERQVAAAQEGAQRAQSTPGTSGTKVWALNQLVDWEEYQAALIHQQAVEEALAMAIAARAVAQNDLNEATILATPFLTEMAEIEAQLADPATTEEMRKQLLIRKDALAVAVAQAKLAVAIANTGFTTADGTVTALKVEQKNARAGVAGATPTTPIAAGEQSQAGVNDNSPMGMISRAAREYAKTSGVFASTSDTIADGIAGTFDALASGINKTIQQISDGSITIKGAFQNIMGGILQQLQQTATKIAADAVMKWVLQLVMSWGNPLAGVGNPMSGITPNGSINPAGTPGFRTGGEIKARRMAGGGGVMNRDSVHILAEPGEVMMRKSAVQMVGKQNLLNINALGNRSLSQAGAAGQTVIKKEADKVNVWVVSPNQVPPAGAKDIVHYVAQDIAAGGTLKKLVKQVAMGG